VIWRYSTFTWQIDCERIGKVHVDLKKANTSTNSTQLTCKVMIEGITENAMEIAQNQYWNFLLK
jgi:hypothetical protein